MVGGQDWRCGRKSQKGWGRVAWPAHGGVLRVEPDPAPPTPHPPPLPHSAPVWFALREQHGETMMSKGQLIGIELSMSGTRSG